MIRESIVITLGAEARPHIAPMGVIWQEGSPILAPFRPSLLKLLKKEWMAWGTQPR